MKHLALCLSFASTILILKPVNAQVRDSMKWSIEQCFQYAAEHNIQVSTLRLNELSSEQDLYAAKGARIPSLSASFSTGVFFGYYPALKASKLDPIEALWYE